MKFANIASSVPLSERFSKDHPLKHTRKSGCLHITTETTNLARILKSAGTDIVLCACNLPARMMMSLLHCLNTTVTGLCDTWRVNIPALEVICVSKQWLPPSFDEFTLTDGRGLRLLAEDRLVNLAAAEGHPSVVMDMSFANQVLCATWVIQSDNLDTPYTSPPEIDQEVAQRNWLR